MSKQSDRLRLLNNYPLELHCCPLAKLEYFGQCGNINCPANISRHGSASGCFLQTANPSITDVGAQLHISTREVKRQYQRVIQRAERFLQFYQWLHGLRANYIYSPDLKARRPKEKYCQHCGISGTRQCVNLKRCQRRARFWYRLQSRYPFDVPELKLTNYELWHIVNAQQQQLIEILPATLQQRGEKLIRLVSRSSPKPASQTQTGVSHVAA